MLKHVVSRSVIKRMPRYYRFLNDLLKMGIHRISSKELSERMGLTASQIRQDLNCFGGFGQQGYGYNVRLLHNEIANILGVNNSVNCILLGAGNLGKTIAAHMDFPSRGFNLIGIFDNNPQLIGTRTNDLEILDVADLEAFCKRYSPKVAILCIPKTNAKQVAEELITYGILGFWNFSHYDLSLDFGNVVVENVHLGDSLMTLCYRVNESLRKIES